MRDNTAKVNQDPLGIFATFNSQRGMLSMLCFSRNVLSNAVNVGFRSAGPDDQKIGYIGLLPDIQDRQVPGFEVISFFTNELRKFGNLQSFVLLPVQALRLGLIVILTWPAWPWVLLVRHSSTDKAGVDEYNDRPLNGVLRVACPRPVEPAIRSLI